MPEPTFSMTADDDLPRTIRREREARDREAREREVREREARDRQAASSSARSQQHEADIDIDIPRAPVATVVDFDVPMTKLAAFFVKAVFAAVPALLILMVMLWVLGHTLQTFLPQLLKMKVLIYMP